MQVRMLQNAMGPSGPLARGTTYDLVEALALDLVGTSRAEFVTPPVRHPVLAGFSPEAAASLEYLVSGGGKNLLIADGGTGVTSGWLYASYNPERFALELSVATGGSAASLTLDASDDGVVSAAQIATVALDVVGQQFITRAIGIPYKYLRWTIVSAGTGNVRIARGA